MWWSHVGGSGGYTLHVTPPQTTALFTVYTEAFPDAFCFLRLENRRVIRSVHRCL
jgi:hypothetical protein